MKKSLKIALIVATCLVGAGFLIFVGAMVGMSVTGQGYKSLNTVDFVKNTYEVKEDFLSISVNGAECDVRLLPSDDGTCKVVCSEAENIYHTVEVKNGTLQIQRKDDRKWYESFGIYWGRMELLIYLPKNELGTLNVSCAGGDVTIPGGFKFNSADISTASGEVNFSADVANDLKIKTVSGDAEVYRAAYGNLSVEASSGDVTVASYKGTGNIYVKTVSGDISMKNVECGDITAKTTSGEVEYESVLASSMKIESVSGEIEFERCDADSIILRSTSGEISGSLLSAKRFVTKSVSGRIRVPSTDSDEVCDVKTTSGNIYIRIAK